MPSWFEQQGITGYQPTYEQGGLNGRMPGEFDVMGGPVPAQIPDMQTNAFNPGQQVGHDGTINGMTREQYRDAWQSSGARSIDDLNRFIAANGGTLQSGNGTVLTPFGESIDMLQGARTNGNGSAAWGDIGGGPAAPQTLGNLGGDMVAQLAPGGMPPQATTNSGGGVSGGWDGTKYTATPLTAAPDYTPQNVAGPSPLTLAQLSQPDAVRADQVGPGQQVNAQQVGPGERVTASQVTGPAALQAQQLADAPQLHNLTAEELQTDPSYQFRLKQGLGAMQNSAAAKGTLFGGATLKALNDYAGESASQEYAAANQRAQQVAQGNITNRANTVGQNNAANAQAYGLTNQYQQQAQLANQQAGLQAGQFNSAQAQQNAQFNAANALQAGQFNSQQAQQAALANQQANLNAGQFNAGMNFNTQQGNIANQLAAYQAYQPLAQQNAQFNAQQQAAAAQNNFANRFAVEQGNNQNAQNAWQGNVNAQLGQGNLNLGYTQAANSYNLGLGNLALGNKQADQSYQLGLGNLGVAQGGLGLAANNQAFNQGLATFNTNYGVFRDNRDTAFNQQYALAGLGQNAAAGYGNQVGNAYTNQGNANAAAGIAQGNAWSGALGTLGNTAQQYAYWRGQQV